MNNILLKDYLIEITKGTTPTTIGGEFIESGVNFVKAECLNTGRIIDKSSLSYISPEIHKKLNRSILQEDDLLFSIAGHLGKMAIVRKEDLPANTNQAVAILRIDQKKGDVNFLYYYLNSTQISNYIRKQCAQSVQPNLNLAQVGQLPIIVYSLPTQKSIAKVLSDLDAKIELNNKINRELEAMAKTLYDYWFVQFDFPTPPSSTSGIVGKPYKSSGGKMVYNEELKREIPEGWGVKELGKLIDIQRGISYKSSDISGGGIPMISLNSFNLDGTYKAGGIKSYSGKYTDKQIAKSEDLLIAATDVTRNADIIGKAIIVPHYYKNDLVFSMDIAKIIPKKDISSPYLMMLFNSDHYHNYIKWYASGTIVLHLNMDGVKWYKAEIPPIDLIERFDSFYLPIANRINETERQNEQLTALRDWLLPMLMNGQVASRASATEE